jgi:hypothetical protein
LRANLAVFALGTASWLPSSHGWTLQRNCNGQSLFLKLVRSPLSLDKREWKRRSQCKSAQNFKEEYLENAKRKIELYVRYRGKPERTWTKEDRAERKTFDITMLSEYAEQSAVEFIARRLWRGREGSACRRSLLIFSKISTSTKERMTR